MTHDRTSSPVKVLYVIGPTRSGSTLLARVLNEFGGVVAAGEVVSLDAVFQSCRVQRLGSGNQCVGVRLNHDGASAPHRFSALCGCGAPVCDCPVWRRVEGEAFGTPPDYTRWSWSAVRPTSRDLLRNGVRSWIPNDVGELSVVSEAIYRAFARATGARVVVDDSKTPLFAQFLYRQPWADVALVRLVRDPRATAASWASPKPYAGLVGATLPTHGPLTSTVAWLKRVVLADRLFGTRARLIRFEDFVERPVEIAAELLGAMGVDAHAPAYADEHTLEFHENHIVAGNPDKFERGRLRIRSATSDAARLPGGRRALVTALAVPYVKRYAYPLTPRTSAR